MIHDPSLLLHDPERLRRQRVIDALTDIVKFDDCREMRTVATRRFLDLTDPEPKREPDL